MNGHVIPGTPIAVDVWKISNVSQARLFFLTHLHGDHINGLTSSWRYPIYTSALNANLLSLRFKFPEDVVRKLEIGESYSIPMDDDDKHMLTVTLLDANHVPGAVMFLFQGYFGNYLYCGDMRWYPELLENPPLKSVVELGELDCLYLDNTFSAPYCVFPSRKQAAQQVFRIIDNHPESVIKIGVRSLGKEALLEAVAHRYQERILVSQQKYKTLQVLQCSDVFTTDPKMSRIHAMPFNQITSTAHDIWNERESTVSILLTALFVGWPNGPYSGCREKGLYVVPYSDHSSYPELLEMVSALSPKKVLPIVTSWSTRSYWSSDSAPDQSVKGIMSVYDHLLRNSLPESVSVPKSVLQSRKAGKVKSLKRIQQSALQRVQKRLLMTRKFPYGVKYCSSESSTSSLNITKKKIMNLQPSSCPSQKLEIEDCSGTLKSIKEITLRKENKSLGKVGEAETQNFQKNISSKNVNMNIRTSPGSTDKETHLRLNDTKTLAKVTKNLESASSVKAISIDNQCSSSHLLVSKDCNVNTSHSRKMGPVKNSSGASLPESPELLKETESEMKGKSSCRKKRKALEMNSNNGTDICAEKVERKRIISKLIESVEKQAGDINNEVTINNTLNGVLGKVNVLNSALEKLISLI
ncbi:5' exonuclease Apollo [Halocaridina rubra]|uniref:5' exonuclease Apollo n=1 Tax=Halocaridina rubra TaxID=373956 RepID=A0AAN8WXB3_HALRR